MLLKLAGAMRISSPLECSISIVTEITEPFRLPAEELSKGVSPQLLSAYGFSPDQADNPDLNLGTVVVEGYSYGGGRSWSIMARSVTTTPEYQVFGSADLLDDTGAQISPEQALASAREWIVNSEGTEWVPGPFVLLHKEAGAFAGVGLVRAHGREITQDLSFGI